MFLLFSISPVCRPTGLKQEYALEAAEARRRIDLGALRAQLATEGRAAVREAVAEAAGAKEKEMVAVIDAALDTSLAANQAIEKLGV